MMPPDMQRRVTYRPEVIERVVQLETNIEYMKDAVNGINTDLKSHIAEETDLIRTISISIQKVADASESNRVTMERMSSTIDTIATQNVRVHSLEEFRSRTDKFMESAHTRINQAYEKVERLYWVAGILVTCLTGLWAVITFAAKFAK